MVLYDSSIARRMLCDIRNKMGDYVWGKVISDKNKIFSHEENISGWIEVKHLNEIYSDQRNISDIISGSLLFDNDEDPREFILPVKWMYPHEDFDTLRSSEYFAFENGQAFQLGSHEALVKDDMIHWKNLQIPLADFKGRSILIPDEKMWAEFLNRKIIMADLSDPDKCNKVVAFGTEDDCYMTFSDKFNFMPRRNIKNELTWKADQYHERQLKLNPRAHKFMGQQLLFGSRQFLKNRREQICEKSGLQIMHAPALFIVNRYIKNHDNFIESFLNGSRGAPGADSGDANRPQPTHITDHEIYRLFRGKHSDRTLARTVFADDQFIIVGEGTRHKTGCNPFHIYCRKPGLNRSDGFVSPLRLD